MRSMPMRRKLAIVLASLIVLNSVIRLIEAQTVTISSWGLLLLVPIVLAFGFSYDDSSKSASKDDMPQNIMGSQAYETEDFVELDEVVVL